MNNIQVHVLSHYNQLSQAEQKVADYFLAHTGEIYSLPIAELARRSGVSAGTWVRFCKSIGFKGVKELKQALFSRASEGSLSGPVEDQTLVFTDIKDHTSTQHIIETVRASSMQAVDNTMQIVEPDALEQAAERIMHARSVKLFGTGASSLVANDLYFKLLRIGIDAIFSSDLHLQLTTAATMTPDDLAIIFSNSGRTREMLEIRDVVKENGASTLAITSVGRNPLSQGADLLLQTSSPEIHHRSGAMSSRIAQMVLVDCLFTTLANRHYEAIKQNLEKSYDVSLPHRDLH